LALRRQWHLEEVASGNCAEDTDSNTADDERTEDGLDEDGVLNLAQSGLLDPDFAVEDLADDIALLVPSDPRLVLPRVAGSVRADGVCRVLLCVVALRLVVGREELPRSQVAVVHAVEDDTHALPGSNERGDADDEANQGKNPPGTTSTAQSEEDGDNETGNNATDAQTTRKDDARAVAITDRPANEVRVSLATQRPLDCSDDILEGRRVSGVLQSMKQPTALLGRKVELARSTVGDVDRDDAVDLLTVGLNGYCGV
jgi:hypothetical protein